MLYEERVIRQVINGGLSTSLKEAVSETTPVHHEKKVVHQQCLVFAEESPHVGKQHDFCQDCWQRIRIFIIKHPMKTNHVINVSKKRQLQREAHFPLVLDCL